MGHPFVPPRDCPWRGVIIRAIYIYTKLSMSCPFLPPEISVTDTQAFRVWLSQDPGHYPGSPFHNGLKLFI